MRYITVTVSVPDNEITPDEVDEIVGNMVETVGPRAIVTAYDVSDIHNETWLYGGDRIEEGAK